MKRLTTPAEKPDFAMPESGNFGWKLLNRPQSREMNLSMVVQRFAPGGWFEEHDHDLDQYFYVMSGCFEMVIAGETVCCNKGDLVFVSRNEPHSGRNTAHAESELLVVDYWPSDSTSDLGFDD